MRENTPTIFVIFGVTGDLARVKLLISLYRLFDKGLLPKEFRVVGFSRRPFTSSEFRDYIEGVLDECGAPSGAKRAAFVRLCICAQGDFSEKSGYENLAGTLKAVDDEIGQCTNK